MERIFAVTTAQGPDWDAARPLERQAGWQAHADFMNALRVEGFVLLGGTLDDVPGRAAGALLVVRARDAEEVRWRLAADPWAKQGLLRLESVRAWTLRLGEDFETGWAPARAHAAASQGKTRSRARRANKSQGRRATKAKESQEKPRLFRSGRRRRACLHTPGRVWRPAPARSRRMSVEVGASR